MLQLFVKWLCLILFDIAAAIIFIGVFLELKGGYCSILLQRPVNTGWFGIVPEHPNPAPMWITRIRGPFPLPAGLADYGIMSVAEGDVILRGRTSNAAYQSLSFYPNTYPRLGSASPSVLDFKDIKFENDGSFVIHISEHKDDDMSNWMDSQSAPGGMIALRSYRPEPAAVIEYPSIEVSGRLIQEKTTVHFEGNRS